MFRKGSTEQYNHQKMNKRHYKEASVFLLVDTPWVLVTRSITISMESLSAPRGVQMHVSASPFCSVPVTGNHGICRGFKCKAQKLALGNLSGNGCWANHSISQRLRKHGWGQAAKSMTQVMLQKQPGGYHCGGHGHTCQGLHHRAPPTSTGWSLLPLNRCHSHLWR